MLTDKELITASRVAGRRLYGDDYIGDDSIAEIYCLSRQEYANTYGADEVEEMYFAFNPFTQKGFEAAGLPPTDFLVDNVLYLRGMENDILVVTW